MEVSLASLNEWFSAHALKVNTTKTQLMVFGSRQILRNLPDFTISFCDAELQLSAQVRNLGVVFDGALSWEARLRAQPQLHWHAHRTLSRAALSPRRSTQNYSDGLSHLTNPVLLHSLWQRLPKKL